MTLEIKPGPLLSERTTLGLGGRALAEVAGDLPQDYEGLGQTMKSLGGEPMAFGRGSNILARDGELPLVLVRPPRGPDIDIAGRDRGRVLVRAGGGVKLPRVLAWLAGQGLSGLEGLCGVPGELGGSVAMNAGSYGVEIGSRLNRVKVFTPSKGAVWIGPDRFELGYRSFRLKGEQGFFLILEVELWLDPAESRDVEMKMREVFKKKKAAQPVTARSAGCVFKNPAPDVSAGLLLDKAGLKGFGIGSMAFSEMHANFLVNKGGGASAEAFELLDLAEEKVRSMFGYGLEKEVRICPFN